MNWTIRVKPDIEFHNGKTLSAEDVLFTFQRIVDPKNPALGALSLKALDIANAKKLDRHTVQIPCHTPFSSPERHPGLLPLLRRAGGLRLERTRSGPVPSSTSRSSPAGRAPSRRTSTTGKAGLPYLDRLVIRDFPGEVSQVNALGSGDVDVIDLISTYSIVAVRSGGNDVIITWGGGYTPFTMRVDRPPFDDVRVRQAFRLVCDRQGMLDTVFSGNGRIGNDVFGLRDVLYDSALPQRVQDLDQARSLLAQAGHSNLTVTLVTSAIGPGTVQVAQVLAQQAAQAGVTVNLKMVTPSEFFGPNYLRWTFAQDTWMYYPYFSNVLQATVAGLRSTSATRTTRPTRRLYRQALATVDETEESGDRPRDATDGVLGSGERLHHPVLQPRHRRLCLTSERCGLEQDGPSPRRLWLQEHVAVMTFPWRAREGNGAGPA